MSSSPAGLPSGFPELLAESVGLPCAKCIIEAFSAPASVSVRLNPLKIKDISGSELFPDSRPIAWNHWGRLLQDRPSFTLDPLMHSGAYYVQDSSAMFPSWLFRQLVPSLISEAGDRPLRVLDLCAAPGGKTTDLAASLREACGDNFLLVANEVISQRASVLSDNVARWGDPNVMVTSVDPGAFASFEGFFDAVVADVPCSGEGMFRKDAQAVRDWSESTVALCATRQRRILSDIWPALRDGGVFIMSTCTFNHDENDDNAHWCVEGLGAERVLVNQNFDGVISTKYGFLLAPGCVPGEGQWCAALRKKGMEKTFISKALPKSRNTFESYASLLNVPVHIKMKGMDTLIAIPSCITPETLALEALRPLQTGVALGTLKGKTLVPSEDLALSRILKSDAFPVVDTDCGTALAYLHRDSFALSDAPVGHLMLSHRGLRYGVVKNLGTRCNNLHPRNRRIMMDIKI